MGLDSIEIVMEIQDEFEVRIPDEDAEQLRTVGDIIDYVERRLREIPRPPASAKDRAAAERVVRIVAETLRVDPASITRDSRLAEDLGAN
jgi:acyl carrier protein